jgi:hypothetical protein
MKEKKKAHYGVVILTHHPEKGKVAILRVRGQLRSNGKPELYPGSCQITFQLRHEKRTSIPDLFDKKIADFFGLLEVLTHRKLTFLNKKELPDKVVVNYGLFLPWDPIKTKLSEHGACIRYAAEEDLLRIKNIKDFDKGHGVTDSSITAMFSDEASALADAFKKIDRPST